MQHFYNYSEKKETEEIFPNNFQKTTIIYNEKIEKEKQTVRKTEREQPSMPYVSLLTEILAN